MDDCLAMDIAPRLLLLHTVPKRRRGLDAFIADISQPFIA